jgi:hypothetical protein
MELSKEEIQKVEHYLNTKHIVYVDIRLEVLDHIVTEIEEIMSAENKNFQETFAPVKQRWNSQLKETSSLFFGVGFCAPKIVIQKARKVYWKHYLLLLASYFIPFVLFIHYNLKIQNPSNFNFFIILKSIVMISFISFFYMLLAKNNKIETTYSFILKAQSLGLLMGLIAVPMFFFRLKELNGINVGLFCAFIFSTVSYFHFYKKHKVAIQQSKIS